MNKLKLFALAFAALFTGSAIAADYTPTKVYTVGDETTLGSTWTSKNQTANYFVVDNAVVFNAYICYQSAGSGKQEWTGNSGSGSTGATWTATDIFKGSDAWGVETIATARNNRIYYYNVTNCMEIRALVNCKGTGRTLTIAAYEITDGIVATETTLKATYTANADGVVTLTGLTPSKSYQIAINTDSGSNSNLYEVAFISTPQVTDAPILSAYVIEGLKATINQETKTITAELPYGSDKDAAINAAVVTLGGTATSYSYNTDKTELTITDGTNNVTYTLNINIGAFKCGEIINATLTSGTAATVTGTIGGTASVSLSSSKKLDKGKYFGITLASGTFMEGDVVNINVTTAAGQGFVAIYADKDMTTPLYEAEDWGAAGDNEFVLSKEATGQTSLWIARNDDINKWNPVLNFISVTRACDNSIVGFTLAGAEAVIDNEAKTITIELPFGTELTDEDWNKAYTAAGPDAANVTYGENHATLTVGDITYTLNITIAAAPSSDATLKSITVNGTAITLEEGKTEYTFALPYKTTELPIVTAEANDANATVAISEITSTAQTVTITVTAQDNSKQEYSIAISVQTAPKTFLQIIMSNHYSAWNPEGDDNIYAYYLAGTEKPSIIAEEVVLCSTATAYALSEDGATLTVTGEDATTKDYPFVCEAVTPATTLNQTITFDGSESWIKGGYGYDTTKGWKFSKTDTDYSREWNGKTHIEMFLPACDAVILTGSDISARKIKVYINGIEFGDFTTVKNGDLTLDVKQNASFMLTIASAQTNGDGGFSAAKLIKNETVAATAIKFEQPMYNMTEGETLTLNVISTPEDASLEGLVWTSSDTDIATVADGVVTAVAGGEVTITATLGELTATCDIYVYPALENIYFNTDEFDTTIELTEEALPLPLIVEPYGANTTGITFTSSKPEVATVTEQSSFGYTQYLLNTLSVGTTTITATAPNGKTATITITVTPAKIHATAIALDKTELTLNVEQSYTFAVTLTPADAEDNLTWTSSNEDVATIADGVVTAKNVGTAYITVTTEWWYDAMCKVIVKDKSTGLENISELNTNAPMYNVLGEQVNAEYKGIVIQNGKKFLLQ